MDCVQCRSKQCREAEPCTVGAFVPGDVTQRYHEQDAQRIVQSAAELVDDGRAGTLSRLEELVDFIRTQKYQKVGLAYCYGMENDAARMKGYFRERGIVLRTVSCTVGGMAQQAANERSSDPHVSCNPLGQAEQLNAEKTDLVILMGICLGHDILLQRSLQCDFTTFVVKDRVHQHRPLDALRT